MKITKLNRRFKVFKEHGHTVGLKFPSWGKEAGHVEQIMKDRYGPQWRWTSSPAPEWSGYFGHASINSNGSRPYWITFKNESDLSMILLTLGV